MPAHVHYVEPYAGGLSVLLAKDPEGVSEVVNDLNGSLMNFWRVIASEHSFGHFQRRIEATPLSESTWHEAAVTHDDDGPIRAACDFFVRCRQSLAGRMKDFATLSRTRTRRGMNEQASAWLTAVDGLPAVHERLKRVAILKRNALDVIRQQDGPGTLFYCDPPYLHETRASTGEYAHEMTKTQHCDMLDLLTDNLAGKVMLSGYRSALYDRMLGGWTRHDFSLPNNAAGGAEKRRMVESVWCNW